MRDWIGVALWTAVLVAGAIFFISIMAAKAILQYVFHVKP
jgi:hypothetical protein